MLFMLAYYKLSGFNAVMSIVVNLVILLGLMAYLGATMTLPGIAGFILTIGMGVDSNVLIFERIKEELETGKSVKQAVAAGFDRVFLTILDTHVASLIAAAFLFQFGTGPIRGFATTLTIGLLSNVFTAVFVSRAMFELVLSRRQRRQIEHLGMDFLKNPNFNFIKWRWHAIALSAVVILAGVALIASRGMPLGIDFSGGTLVVVRFEQPVGEDAVRDALDAIPGDKVIQPYGEPSDNNGSSGCPHAGAEEGANLEAGAHAVVNGLQAANIGKFELLSQEIVGPVIGRDLQMKGIYATLASIVGITIYIGLRFRFAFAIGAIAATFHDILVTLAFLVFFGYDLSLNIVAALLTITGYSVNDTIVIFDRVRENLRTTKREPLEQVVNRSVNQTLSRTIITAGTTFLSVLSLYLFGGEVLEGFAFTMLVGIVSGTYSTIFIAAAIAILLSGKQAKGRQTTTARPASGGRKAS